MRSHFYQKRKWNKLNWIKLLFFFALIVTFSLLLFTINNMFLSVLLAIILSQVIRPLVDRIEDFFGINRLLATTMSFISLGILVGIGIFWALPFLAEQFLVLKVEVPKYIEGSNKLIDQVEQQIKVFLPIEDHFTLTNRAKSFFVSQLTLFVQDLPKVITNSFSVFFLCPFIAFFMVKDSYRIRRGFLALVPNHVFETALSLTHQIGEQIGRFIRARLLEATIVGIITGVGLQILSFPYAMLLGLFAGVMNLIPYLGPLIAYVPAILIGLVNNMSFFDLSIMTSVYLVTQTIDNIILTPVLVARMMKLHPVTVIVVIIAGAQFMGILGMLISIPVANALQITYHAFYQHIINTETT